LPPVDWGQIDKKPPAAVAVAYRGPEAPLPRADVAILTWTSAEWSALDHVFLGSGSAGARSPYELGSGWYLYGLNAAGLATDNPLAPLWGYYNLVEVGAGSEGLLVLLFKSDAHLAHPPWIAGLEQLLGQILDDSEVAWVYSVGTAGGSAESERLGDIVVTNSAHIQLKNPGNLGAPIDNQTFTCGAFPSTRVVEEAQQLLFPLGTVVTDAALASLVQQLHAQVPDSVPFGLADLLNSSLGPENLDQPTPRPKPDVPLLTTDFYFIASGDDAAQWAVLEMDDAVIASVAGERDRKYAFVRNISDPIVPELASHGRLIPASVRDRWSGLIYENYGLFTSFNGAIVAWAAIAGGD